MRIEDWNVVHDILADATVELFASIGLPVVLTGQVSHRAVSRSESFAIIGLTGHLRGSLILSMPAGFLMGSHPVRSRNPEDLCDWLAELANLLLGRVKSKLLVHGVSIELSTPMAISSTAFRFERFSGAPSIYEFRHEGEPLHVVFEAIGDEGLQLGPWRSTAVIPVGEMIQF